MVKKLVKYSGCMRFPKKYWTAQEIKNWKTKYLFLIEEEVIVVVKEYNHSVLIDMRNRIRKWILFLWTFLKQKKGTLTVPFQFNYLSDIIIIFVICN